MDEKSMLGLLTFAQVDSQLQQMKPCNSLGWFHITLFSNFAQLPLVSDSLLYDNPLNANTNTAALACDGTIIYHMFNNSI
jgi:hypothetical protein